MAQEEYPAPSQGRPVSSERYDARSSLQAVNSQGYTNPTNPDAEPHRPRGMSTGNQHPPYLDSGRYTSTQAQQPITEAVESAFNTTAAANSSHAISPEILNQLTAQITANVLQQLQGNNLPSPTTSQGPPPGPPIPSPQKTTSPLPDRTAEPYLASAEAAVTASSPTQAQFQSTSYALASSFGGRRPMSPNKEGGDNEQNEERSARPKGPRRISTGGDATVIEKTWGALFNEDGVPTVRLGQFLRGIAVHIIEDYEPKHSLVITPEKIQRYYEETKLQTETYPWNLVFDDRTSSISRLLREFAVQHHYVQDKPDKRPVIPALTPHGFEKWMTAVLQAYPDEEFERLAKTAQDMPISNPDDRKERFPKELSRRLFPRDPDLEIRSKIYQAMKEHCNIKVQDRADSLTDTEGPPPTVFRSDDPAQPSPIKTTVPPVKRQDTVLSPEISAKSPPPGRLGVERETKPPSNAPSEAAVSENDDDMATPQPTRLERERKPYVAEPGGGKRYEGIDKPSTEYPPPPEARPVRTMSMGQGPPSELPKTRTMPIAIHQRYSGALMDPPDMRHLRTNSNYNREPLSRSAARQRSPSLSTNGDGYGHRSESNMIYGGPYMPGAPVDGADEARRVRERDYETIRERHANDRYDPARMTAYDPRDRPPVGGETRQRVQSSVGMEDRRPYYGSSMSDDEYYRATGVHPVGNRMDPPYQSSYPPTSYRA